MGRSLADLSSVTTVGLDLAKHVVQVHGSARAWGTTCLRKPHSLCQAIAGVAEV